MLQAKYNAVLELGKTLNIKNGDVTEENGVLKVTGIAKTQYEKNMLWDKIKEIGGESASDIQAEIGVENTSIYHHHTVSGGETLGKIAKHYYGDAMKYKDIFAANSDVLDNPDVIQPGQELIIPNI